jgi:predicted metal-dependent RNase
MTFKVDNDALKVAMMRHYEEKLGKELRDMFIYAENQDMAKIWQYYLEEVERQDKRQQEHIKNTGEWAIIIIGFGMMGYGFWHLFTAAPT